MQKRPFANTGASLPVIGQGTWQVEEDDEKSAVDALRRGIDLGMTHIDTAEMYGGGRVETLVARAIEGRRDDVYLASKVLPHNASKEGTIAACEKSLRRLATDRLDLYLLHWPGSYPLAETFEAFAMLEKAGKIRAFGVSNFDEREMKKAVDLAGADRIACNQVLYHLEERAIEHAVLPFCEKHGIAVVGYSPFGSGRFPSPKSRGGQTLRKIASRREATPHQVALAFLVRRPSLFAIPKAASVAHVEANAKAAQLILDETDLRELDEAFPLGPKRSGVPTL